MNISMGILLQWYMLDNEVVMNRADNTKHGTLVSILD